MHEIVTFSIQYLEQILCIYTCIDISPSCISTICANSKAIEGSCQKIRSTKYIKEWKTLKSSCPKSSGNNLCIHFLDRVSHRISMCIICRSFFRYLKINNQFFLYYHKGRILGQRDKKGQTRFSKVFCFENGGASSSSGDLRISAFF